MRSGKVHAIAGGLALPFALPARKRRTEFIGMRLENFFGLFGLWSNDGGCAGFQDPRFLARYQCDRIAKKSLVVERDRRDRSDRGMADHIGCVEPAAEPGLEQHDVRRYPSKCEKRCSGRDLEIGDRRAAIGALALLEQCDKRVLLDQPPVKPNTLVKAHEMRL